MEKVYEKKGHHRRSTSELLFCALLWLYEAYRQPEAVYPSPEDALTLQCALTGQEPVVVLKS